jgi:hypothetical protein
LRALGSVRLRLLLLLGSRAIPSDRSGTSDKLGVVGVDVCRLNGNQTLSVLAGRAQPLPKKLRDDLNELRM